MSNGNHWELVQLENIVPNPKQPRRLISAQTAQGILSGQVTLLDAYKLLFQNKTPYAKRMNEELISLAQSIQTEEQSKPESHGLVNAITIYPLDDGRFMIETGEIRFWAMLHLRETTKPMWRKKFAAIPAFIIEQGSASRQAVENIQRRSMNSMEMAWAMQRVWDELAANPPEGFLHQAQKTSPLGGRPSEWPSWPEVASRVGLSYRTVVGYITLLELDPEAQQIIHQFDIPERRLRYMLRNLPRPGYNPQILDLLRQATASGNVWSEAKFREETDRIFKIERRRIPKPRQAVNRLRQVTTDLHNIMALSASEIDAPGALVSYQEIYGEEKDIEAILELKMTARAVLPLIRALAGEPVESGNEQS